MIGTIRLITLWERTKEIGVMNAIGGPDGDVPGVFLLEAGIIGMIAGFLPARRAVQIQPVEAISYD